MRLSHQTASPKPARYEHTNINNYFQKLEYGNNDSVEYTYDKQGQAKYADCDIVICNAATYHYVKILQCDVMSIVDAQGAVIASHAYDPYGNLISDEPAENTIGHLNPIRYRGYYYDSESGLYYLQSRYYDPVIGRFLNADAFTSTGQGIIGNNMFAYCNNNPVIRSDPTGCWSWKNLFNFAATVTVVAIVVAVVVISGGSAAPPLLMAASALAGTTVTATTVATAAVGTAIVGTTVMGVSVTATILEASNKNTFSKPTSQNQMQKQVERDQAPSEVDRVDKPHVNAPDQQNHIHFKDGSAINMDGTLSHEGRGVPHLTNEIIKWILSNGWQIAETLLED